MLTQDEIKQLPEYDNHERVEYFSDIESGLRGYIAIHNTNLGPAVGGTRMQAYPSEEAAVKDVLKLSHSMTYKCAFAGVRYGGGKVVVIGDPEKAKTEKLLRAYGRVIENFGGLIRTGVDVGMEDKDVAVMAEESKYFVGVLKDHEKLATSDMAALSTFTGIRASLQRKFGSADISGKKIAVKGLGKLGGELVRLLHKEGAKLIVADINQGRVDKILAEFPGVETVFHEVIHKSECDVFSPCALGGELTDQTVRQLNCKIVCGGANDQLEVPQVGDLLFDLGVLYAPDYVVNAGGLINVVDELEPDGYSKERVLQRIERISTFLQQIFGQSEAEKLSPNSIANKLAEKVIYGGKTEVKAVPLTI